MSGEDTNVLLSFVHKVEIRKFLNLLYLHEDNAMKKLVSLLLVAVLVFTFMAVSVSAITARGLVCSNCGGDQTTTTQLTKTKNESVSSCDGIHDYHMHSNTYKYYRTYCQSCGKAREHSFALISSVCRG